MKPQHSVIGLSLTLLICAASQPTHEQAHVTIDIRQARGHISELLYGQFIEFMYGGVKDG